MTAIRQRADQSDRSDCGANILGAFALTMPSWMILSQFARVRSTSGTTIKHSPDLQIMLSVGTAEMPLMREQLAVQTD